MSCSKVRVCLIVSILSISSWGVHAQLNVGVEVDYVYGFPQDEIHLMGNNYYQETVQGVLTRANVLYRLHETPVAFGIKAGYKYLNVQGGGEDLTFVSESYRLNLAAGLQFAPSDNFELSLYAALENNLDFIDFRTQTNDLFRYQLEFSGQYALSRRIYLGIHYNLAVYPIQDFYIIYNPQHQLYVGLTYFILKQ